MEEASQRICTDLRRYNKEKGWPLAHEAADRIEALEKHLDIVYAFIDALPTCREDLISEERP